MTVKGTYTRKYLVPDVLVTPVPSYISTKIK